MIKKSDTIKIMNILWIICIIGFLAFLGLRDSKLFFNSAYGIFLAESDSITEESTMAQTIKDRMKYVHLNGLGARVLHQKILNGVILDQDGMMYNLSDMNTSLDIDAQTKAAKDVDAIYALSNEMDIEFLYVQRPIKYPSACLPYGYCNLSDPDLEAFRLNYCKSKGERYLDLREVLGENLEFYRTDHHWTVETAYQAARCIEERLGHETDVYDSSNFNKLTYSNCFLGSMGIRTGKYFGGIDDIEFLIPTYSTSFHYQHYINHELTLEKEGDFATAFLDYDILNNKEYYNKHEANLNGSYVETRIINNEADNDKKVLVIADSYGKAMSMYTALNYHETRYLDPQNGRYTDNYLDYIRDYQPDIIIEMAFLDINVGQE